MNKYYVGQLSRAVTHFNLTDKPAKVELVFNNGDFSEEMPFKLDHEYYVVEKAELNAYMARKEQLEQMNCTPVFAENQRLKAKVNELEAKIANLTEINKSLGEENSKLAEKNKALKDTICRFFSITSNEEELRAANEKLKGEVTELKERIDHLKIIQRLLAKENTSLLIENNKLCGTKNELDTTVAWLKRELAKYSGVQECVDIRAECVDLDRYAIWWKERNGVEHKLELKLVQNPMDETTRIGTSIYE